MIVCFHLVAFLVNEHFTPEWQKEARDITREVVAAMVEADAEVSLTLRAKKEPLVPIVTIPGA